MVLSENDNPVLHEGTVSTWDKLVHHVAEVVEPIAIEDRPCLSSQDRVREKVAIVLQKKNVDQ